MNMGFLETVFYVLSTEGQGGLYEYTAECIQKEKILTEKLEQAGIERGKMLDIDTASTDVEAAAELQGFINGWRLCNMLNDEMSFGAKKEV